MRGKMFEHMYMFRLDRVWKMNGYYECFKGKNSYKSGKAYGTTFRAQTVVVRLKNCINTREPQLVIKNACLLCLLPVL